MGGAYDFKKEGNVNVSASIGRKLYDEARLLQEQGVEEAFWSNAMRRGLKLVIDIHNGHTDPEEAIKRMRERLEEAHREIERLQHGNI